MIGALFAPFIAAMALVLELVALGIGGALELVGSRIATDRTRDKVKTPRRWSRILLVLAASLAVVTCGILLVLERAVDGYRKARARAGPSRYRSQPVGVERFIRIAVMFHLTCLGWVLFRAQTWDIAWEMLSRCLVWHGGTVIGLRVALLTALCGGFHVLGTVRPAVIRWQPGPVFRGAVMAASVMVLLICAPGERPFLYFQF